MTMTNRFAFLLFLSVSLGACGGGDQSAPPAPTVVEPYESCDDQTDTCDQGLTCLPTTLPASAGYTGELCTSTCQSDGDCAQDLTNYPSICVNEQCYTSCPDGGAACPYGTQCVQFTDTEGDAINICTP